MPAASTTTHAPSGPAPAAEAPKPTPVDADPIVDPIHKSFNLKHDHPILKGAKIEPGTEIEHKGKKYAAKNPITGGWHFQEVLKK